MKIINIDIKRSLIDRQLSKITAYTGAKSKGIDSPDDFDRVATIDEDAELLTRYWNNAANVLAQLVKEFISNFSVNEDNIEMTLTLSESFDDSLAEGVREGMNAFVAAFIAKGWFSLTFPEKADEWRDESSRLLSEISRNIYHRRRPLRQQKPKN